MPTVNLTDELGQSAPNVKIDLSQPSSLLNYAKTQIPDLKVVSDFTARAPQLLSAAAPNPISFKLEFSNKFQLGASNPEIDLTPGFQTYIRANATPGSGLFDGDPFLIATKVPAHTGYVSLGLQGSLSLGISGTSGDLSFGFNANGSVTLESWKAFPLGAGEPTLGAATGQAISSFVIPADVQDLKLLQVNDVATVTGDGSLKVSAAIKVSATPNPLASVDLPLNAGTVQVIAGVMAGISGSYAISGSYQIRAHCTAPGVVELSFLKKKGTNLQIDLNASAGISVNFNNTDLLKNLIGAISTNPAGEIKKVFADGGLTAAEISTFNDAIKAKLDHSFQLSLDLALSKVTDDQAAFQYEIQPALLDANSSAAVHRALEGDLSLLSALEDESEGAQIAPGVKLLSSVVSKSQRSGCSLALNLLGIVNYGSISSLLVKSVVVNDPVSGNLTIADSATGTRINALIEPLRHGKPLRKAMFESLMITAAYRVSDTVQMTGLSSSNFHFAMTESTNPENIADYLRWLVAMNLLNAQQSIAAAQQFPGGGTSTCLLRTVFDDNACHNLFFDAPGQLKTVDTYRDLGRQALRALINPNNSRIDSYRHKMLDQAWQRALEIGPNPTLATLFDLHLTDSSDVMVVDILSSDLFTIVWWADAMHKAGLAVLDMQQFIANADQTTLPDNNGFTMRRDKLIKLMGELIRNSHDQFEEPSGFISLFWAAGSTGGSAKLVANGLQITKP